MDSSLGTAKTLRIAASFFFPFEADVARLRLELEGIRARLADQAMVGWFWKYANAVGGVKVLVSEDDLPRAQETLEPESPPESTPGRWACSHCGARVPSDLDACWACGTTPDGQPDPGFVVADAPIVECDFRRMPTAWWPLACIVFPLLIVYEVLLRVVPERPPVRIKRRVTFAPLDPWVVRACLVATLGAGSPLPLWILSLAMLIGVDRGRGAQRRRTNTFVALALAINLLGSLPITLLFAWILFR